MWWFYTVILGMAFGRGLQELAVTMRDWRHGTRQPFAPAMLWQAFLLVLIVQCSCAARGRTSLWPAVMIVIVCVCIGIGYSTVEVGGPAAT